MNAPARGIHSSGRLAAFLAALILWQLFARVLQGTYLLARPVDILRQLVDKSALVGRALTATLQSAALGYLWGNPAALRRASRFPINPSASCL